MKCEILITSITGDPREVSVRALRAFADAIEFHGRDPTTPFEITVDETPPRPSLTEAQKKVYGTLVKHYQETGRTPTLREVCNRMGTKSSHGIWEQLRRLERKGYLRVEPGIVRGITLLGGSLCPTREASTKSPTKSSGRSSFAATHSADGACAPTATVREEKSLRVD